MNNKDIYNYYMKKVYNEDIGFITTVAKTALEYALSRGATDLAFKNYTYGDTSEDSYKKNKDISKKDDNLKEINLDDKFTSIDRIPHSIKGRSLEFLKYIILEYILASQGFINKQKINEDDFYVFEGKNGILLYNKLDNNNLKQFIIKPEMKKDFYPGTYKITDPNTGFNKKELEIILQKIDQFDVKNIFNNSIKNVFTSGKSIKEKTIEHRELDFVYKFGDLGKILFPKKV